MWSKRRCLKRFSPWAVSSLQRWRPVRCGPQRISFHASGTSTWRDATRQCVRDRNESQSGYKFPTAMRRTSCYDPGGEPRRACSGFVTSRCYNNTHTHTKTRMDFVTVMYTCTNTSALNKKCIITNVYIYKCKCEKKHTYTQKLTEKKENTHAASET